MRSLPLSVGRLGADELSAQLPRQHPAERNLLRRPSYPRWRSRSRGPHSHRSGRQGVRSLHQDHRWCVPPSPSSSLPNPFPHRPTHRPLWRAEAGPPRNLGEAHRGWFRVGAGVRQVSSNRQVVRRLELVSLRRGRFRLARHRPRESVSGGQESAQVQGRGFRMRARVCGGPVEGLWVDCDRQGMEWCVSFFPSSLGFELTRCRQCSLVGTEERTPSTPFFSLRTSLLPRSFASSTDSCVPFFLLFAFDADAHRAAHVLHPHR